VHHLVILLRGLEIVVLIFILIIFSWGLSSGLGEVNLAASGATTICDDVLGANSLRAVVVVLILRFN
jgi:hypothetical protein